MSTLDVTAIKSKLALTPSKFYDKDDKEIGTLCRAWVNFNGTGVVAIRASFNVASITDNGTGDYAINFTNAMPDANYALGGMCRYVQATDADGAFIISSNLTNPTTGLFRIRTGYGDYDYRDCDTVMLQVFR